MKWRGWLVIGMLLGVLIGGSQTVQASTSTFMIRPELPKDNRVGEQAGYFDLKVDQSRRKVALRVYNPEQTPQTIRIRLLQATTQVNGKLDYQPAPAHVTKQFDYVTTKLLAPKAQAQITLTLPNRTTIGTGTKLMAIELTTTNAKAHVTVNNRVRYRIGLVLQGQARAATPLALTTVGKRVDLQKPTLHFNLVAKDGRFRSAMTVRTNLQHANQPWLSYQLTQTHLRWAPDTTLPLAVHLAGKQLQPGIYRVVLQTHAGKEHHTITRYLVISHDGHVAWTSAERFAIAQRWWWGAMAAIVSLLVVILVFRQRRKRHAQIDR
ncbi:WxL protein host-binding domain-containing protein [Lacticaseibacillus porcinae]|uniref:WxL protein host-binding domain-containing protein n=1 Tax=Lacticaseibacillus porcinae TaxID=1123687 RepID=UPI000F793620|nr:DUF3324 domain-containing protein [Lacticaseibacillus porcinae]